MTATPQLRSQGLSDPGTIPPAELSRLEREAPIDATLAGKAPNDGVVDCLASGAEAPGFEQLQRLGREAVENGDLGRALELLDSALVLARSQTDADQIDLALCNRSSVAIAVGQHEDALRDLRPILLRSRRPDILFLAADGLARAHELTREFKKGLYYGHAARGYADRTQRSDWLASSFNQIGNCLVGDSRFQEAIEAYDEALARLPEEVSVVRTSVTANLGYCRMMMDDLRGGFRLAFRALRWYRQLYRRAPSNRRQAGTLTGAGLYEAWPHLDLCYAYLELGRFERARQHGLRALGMAERNNDSLVLRNALFLLGETEKAAGNYFSAHEHFERLQCRYYPESPQLLSVLTAVEMRKVVNLRA